MYRIGDMVMHPSAGVCKIEDIREECFSAAGPKRYYILKPVYENGRSTIYLPVENLKVKLRKLLSTEDIYELIHSVTLTNTLWVDNDAQRQERFRRVLVQGDQAQIIQLIIEIHEKQKEKQAAGKKLHMADGKILQEAEKRIHQEFGYALNLKPDEVAPFIMGELAH